ncbi:hypothetical protein [Campylobacter rectus]|uniref:hypothetical protein n=1 Tax=Campylobacter rectus TaxID=203 RepID=UPI0002E12612|nr:hypothetical protein [Campylobacter rectus]UEB48236.1 hypothetical protein LK437_02635 [Campylobacter rectus]
MGQSMKQVTDGASSQASSLQESAAAIEQMNSSMSAINQKMHDASLKRLKYYRHHP